MCLRVLFLSDHACAEISLTGLLRKLRELYTTEECVGEGWGEVPSCSQLLEVPIPSDMRLHSVGP